jgi:spore germination cell wall hydrolase CwlJ-like protein
LTFLPNEYILAANELQGYKMVVWANKKRLRCGLAFVIGMAACALVIDSYQERSAMNARLVAVETEQKATAQNIQEIKDILIRTAQKVNYTPKEEECLAKNIYHEAGVESDVGKVAVGQVTINRLKTGRWGDNLCDVIYAKKQFSWTISKKLKNEKPKGELWENSKRITKKVLSGLRVKTLDKGLFYHTNYIHTPAWVEPGSKITQIDQHIFYTKTKFVLKIKKTQKKKARTRRA